MDAFLRWASTSLNWCGASDERPTTEEEAKEDEELVPHFLFEPYANPQQDFRRPVTPPAYREALDRAVGKLLDLTTSEALWSPAGSANGVESWLRQRGNVCHVRCDGLVLKHPRALFELVTDPACRSLFDWGVQSVAVKAVLGAQTQIEHVVFRAVWPVETHDASVLSHWRVLPSGEIVAVRLSVPHADVPPVAGVKRTQKALEGWVVRPNVDYSAVSVSYVGQLDVEHIEGLPKFVTDCVLGPHLEVLKRIRKVLSRLDDASYFAQGVVRNGNAAAPPPVKLPPGFRGEMSESPATPARALPLPEPPSASPSQVELGPAYVDEYVEEEEGDSEEEEEDLDYYDEDALAATVWERMEESLLEGIPVNVVNKAGRPSPRVLFATPPFLSLHWQKQGDARLRPTDANGLRVRSGMQLQLGCRSPGLRDANALDLVPDTALCLALVGGARPLDLVCDDEDTFALLAAGLQILLKRAEELGVGA